MSRRFPRRTVGIGGIFQRQYTSPGQTITSAGAVTLAHGLGAMPALVQLRLVCGTGEHGYSAGDETLPSPISSNNNDKGVSVVLDATNITLRFGLSATAIEIT